METESVAESPPKVLRLRQPNRSQVVLRAECPEDLVPEVGKAVAAAGVGRVHFVTHSMGGILVRDYLRRHAPPSLGRVVMLAPPNQGSELVDHLGALAVFGWINGPAGRQLGTGADSLPNRLGPVGFPLGVIAGDWSWNPVYSAIIPGADDGKVSVARARIDGMADFVVVPHGHTFLMSAPDVIDEVLHFLRDGHFSRSDMERAS